MADDERDVWNDVAGAAPHGTGASPWSRVLGDQSSLGDGPAQGDLSAQVDGPEQSTVPAQKAEAVATADTAADYQATPGQQPYQPVMPPAAQPAPSPQPRGIGGLWTQVSDAAARFPVAFVMAILAWAVLAEWELDELPLDAIGQPLSLALIAGIGLAALCQLAVERIGRLRGKPWVATALPVALAAALFLVLHALGDTRHEDFSLLVTTGVVLFCVFGSGWLLYDESNERTLFAELLRGFFLAFVMCFLLTGGFGICVLAFGALVYTSVVPFTQIVIAIWALLFPVLVLSQLPRHTDATQPGRAYRAIMGYVILPLCLVLLAILYAYIVRILVAGEMPSGEMNWYGSFALLVEIGLWLGLRPIDNRLAQLFVRWGWALLVPVVAVQLYGVWVRFVAYGLTAARFAGMACLVVGLIALSLAAWQASPRTLFSVAAVVSLLVCVSPVNAVDMANLEQQARMRSAIAAEDGRAALSSWEYLNYSSRGYFDVQLPDRPEFEPAPGDDAEFDTPRYEYRRWYASQTPLVVEGFSKVYDTDVCDQSLGHDETGNEVALRWDDGTVAYVRVEDLVAALPKEDGEVEQSLMTVTFEDGSRLVISALNLEWYGDELSYVWLEGWYLVP